MSSFSLRPGTIDEVVYRAVIEHNEYRIPPLLAETDIIIDIGAHIGSFSWLCWSRGARMIEAFEADPENASYARRNLENTSVVLKQMAVWRSDRPQAVLYHSGYTNMLPGGPDPVGVNTGGGNVFSTSGTPLETIALDKIIGDRTISMLKIDCEGSEYPILLTSQKLKQVRTIVGEYHHLTTGISDIAQVDGILTYSIGTLVDFLTKLRFKVEVLPHPDPFFSQQVGSFFAYNLD
ncbi:MAG: FkbM family methyltransferase [Scytolyngbya sp. HA4215-MV1]|nr:FkbM family methyltransferase [Scytolyngbya sp. HA4215-MV1]